MVYRVAILKDAMFLTTFAVWCSPFPLSQKQGPTWPRNQSQRTRDKYAESEIDPSPIFVSESISTKHKQLKAIY